MSGIDQGLLAEWKGAIGRRTVERQRLEREPLRRYAVAVGGHPDVERAMPPLPHQAFFVPLPSDDRIGADGHPRRGDFLPAVTLPRRMFAASAIGFAAPLTLDADAELVSTIVDIVHKRGASGDLVFAEVERILSQGGTVRMRERQSYVYRAAGAPLALPVPVAPAPAGEAWRPDAVSLFRFSAATFNGHRIHYDAPYATMVEGYPALVVHGPFVAARLAALAERDGALASFSFRALAPLFLGQPIALRRDGGEVAAVRCDGVTAMIAQVSYTQ